LQFGFRGIISVFMIASLLREIHFID